MTDENKPGPSMNDLFASARTEAPSAQSKANAMAKLGLGGPAPSAPTAPVAATKAAVAVKTGAAVKVGAALLIAAAVGGGVLLTRQGEQQPVAPAPVAQVAPPTEVKPPVEPTPAIDEKPPEPAPTTPTAETPRELPPAPTPAPARKTVPGTQRGAEQEEGDSLVRELNALDGVKSQLTAGAPAKALEAVTAYERSFPRGQLATDAALLKIEALMKLGRRDQAQRAADRILSASPSALVRERLQKLLEEK